MNLNIQKGYIALLMAILVWLPSCGGKEFKKNPLDTLIQQMGTDKDYSIILHDMDVDGNFFKSYKHRYRLIETVDSVPQETYTDWMEVPEDYFWANENNLGMELAAMNNGKLSKNVAPPGYHNYVGNSRYGQWQTTPRGETFWSFYGKYALLSSLLNMGTRPVYRREYSDWYGNYRGSRPYYGPSSGGSYKYGTNSSYTRQSRPNFFARRQSKDGFRRSTSRTSRSSGRTGSGFRSRGGGFGK
ncbi:hypothetical protein AB9P05_15820 [Roseivirga sp. BDSF3-8]|uniref:hypothetical protein n=1 Tax=Roseivirga sp. BDSF3-8 TaxID=3241598 RepID=UPI00353191D6